jgi:hypothetical protein
MEPSQDRVELIPRLNDGHHLRKLRNAVYHSAVLESLCVHHTLNTQLLYASPSKIWNLPKIESNWYHDCLDAVNDRNHLQKLRNSAYHSAVLESLNSETTLWHTARTSGLEQFPISPAILFACKAQTRGWRATLAPLLLLYTTYQQMQVTSRCRTLAIYSKQLYL